MVLGCAACRADGANWAAASHGALAYVTACELQSQEWRQGFDGDGAAAAVELSNHMLSST